MTRRTPLTGIAVLSLGVVAGALLLAQTPPATPAQTFRGGTDLVSVEVSVRDGGRAVAGLTAADFVVRDNGVTQRVDAVEQTAVPIDLTLVADVSGDYRRAWTDRVAPAEVAAGVEAQVHAVTGLLRPTDRVRVLTIDSYTHAAGGATPVAARQPLSALESGGLSALYDTLIAALLQPVDMNRRHVIVASTKGFDTISGHDAAAVRDVAQRSEALLHLVMMETAMDNEEEFKRFQCDPVHGMGLCLPTKRFWVPFMRRTVGSAPVHALTAAGIVLAEAATSTGGDLHQAELLAVPSMAGTFRRAFDEFRQSYVLRYTARGVKREGWHELAVSVPSRPGVVVRARRGYAVETAGATAAAATAPAGAASGAPRPLPVAVSWTLDELITAYDRGEFEPVAAALRRVGDPRALLRDFRAAGNPWPATPRREAAFVVELAEAGVYSPISGARESAAALLATYRTLVRHPLEPDAFERHWLWAVLATLQGAIRPAVAQSFVAAALTRFPDEPRFVLANAIVFDQQWPLSPAALATARTGFLVPSTAYVNGVIARYEAAMAFEETAAEARIRLGWFLHRLGRHAEALARLEDLRADRASDAQMRYLRQLFRGHVLSARDRSEDAVAAYRAALEIWPGAQSAQVALMNTLVRRGSMAEAQTLAERVQTAAPTQSDPWWMFWLGDQRFYPAIIARLREMGR
jgi:VWFA-related protein